MSDQTRLIPHMRVNRRWPLLPSKALYGLAGNFVRLVEPHTEANEAALLAQMLVGFGNVIGRCPYFLADGARHYTNIYALIVGETSAAKGSAFSHVKNQLRLIDEDWVNSHIRSGLSSGEGLITAVVNITVASDTRLLVVESEFVSVLQMNKREGNVLSPVLRTLWDDGNAATLTRNNPVSTTNAQVSIIGHITPEDLWRCLGSAEISNGYANRFLFVCAKRSKDLPEGGSLPNDKSMQIARLFIEAVEFAQSVGEMKRDVKANELWRNVYAQLVGDRAGAFGRVTARARPQVLRLSCIYALLDKSSVVRREHLEAALALWKYCEDSVRYIFGEQTGDHVTDIILSALINAGSEGLTRTKISDLFLRNVSANRITNALADLKESGRAYAEQNKNHGQGRPSERWFAKTDDSDAAYERNERNE